MPLRHIQSDRIEREFGIYRRSTGCNPLMVSRDVLSSYQRRLTRFSVEFLETFDSMPVSPSKIHKCNGVTYEQAEIIENLDSVTLSKFEELSVAYVAG